MLLAIKRFIKTAAAYLSEHNQHSIPRIITKINIGKLTDSAVGPERHNQVENNISQNISLALRELEIKIPTEIWRQPYSQRLEW